MSIGLGMMEEADPMLMTTPLPLFTMAGMIKFVMRVTDTTFALIRLEIMVSLLKQTRNDLSVFVSHILS